MMASEYIITVTEADFEYEVVAFSRQVPVVVDFWAEWCGPCKMLGPLLERLTEEARGAYRLAKVNVDENPNLALRFSVRSIPLVKAFRDGQVVSEFIGAQPEPRVREFLRALAPSQSDLLLEKGLSQLDMQAWSAAEDTLRQYLAKTPENPSGLLGLTKSLLMQGDITAAEQAMDLIPPSKELAAAEIIRPLIDALKRLEQIDSSAYSDDPLEAAYINALRLVLRGNIPAAMDGILDVLRQDKHYHHDEARKVMLALLAVLGDENPLTRQYRNELSLVLF